MYLHLKASIQVVYYKGHIYKYERAQHVQTTISSPDFVVATLVSLQYCFCIYFWKIERDSLSVPPQKDVSIVS